MEAQLLSPFRQNQSNGGGPLPASVLKISTDVYKKAGAQLRSPVEAEIQSVKFGKLEIPAWMNQTPIPPRLAVGTLISRPKKVFW